MIKDKNTLSIGNSFFYIYNDGNGMKDASVQDHITTPALGDPS
jgi:hypothetical protein